MKRNYLIAAAVLLAVVAFAPAAHAQKVGFVDFSQILDNTDEGRRINQKIQGKGQDLELRYKELQLELQKMQKELLDQKDVLSEDAFREKYTALQQKAADSQQAFQKDQMDAEKFKVELVKAFVDKVKGIAQQVAKSDGYSLVVLNMEEMNTGVSVVLYGDESVNLTNKVIRQLNAGGGGQ